MVVLYPASTSDLQEDLCRKFQAPRQPGQSEVDEAESAVGVSKGNSVFWSIFDEKISVRPFKRICILVSHYLRYSGMKVRSFR